MMIGILYSIHYWKDTRKYIYLGIAALLFTTLILTGSRTSFIIFLFLAALYAFINLSRKHRIILAVIIVLAIGLLAVTNFRVLRISLFAPTLIERIITYQDALSITGDRLLQGFGIGNWQEQQFMHQSAPYQVRFIHNYYLQLLLDGGIISPVLFLAVAVPALYRGWKQKSIHFFVLLAVILQGVLDFDMIFAAVILITMFSISQMQREKYFEVNIGLYKLTLCIPVIILASIWGSEWFYDKSNRLLLYGRLEESMRACEQSLMLNPINNKILFNMAVSTRDVNITEYYLERAIAKNEFDADSIVTLLRVRIYQERYDEALAFAEELVRKWRFYLPYRRLYRDVVSQAAENGIIDSAQAEEKLNFLTELTSPRNSLYERYIRH
jgi:hypothetical protein